MVCCTVCSNNTRTIGNKSFFNFPRDSIRQQEWLKLIGREELLSKLSNPKTRQQCRICEDHFEKTCIVYSKKRTVKYLRDNAFPTLKLQPEDGECSVLSKHQNVSKLENEDIVKEEIRGEEKRKTSDSNNYSLTIVKNAFTEEMENPSMSMLDKFKRRLVRDIARRLYHEKQTESEMWAQLREEYGCDCHLLWEHMRALTLKKLKRLLAAEDRIDYITKIARMTSTDWLTFDLVLVHEKVDVIGEEMKSTGKPEPAVLTLLFDLVVKYNIESLAPRFLVEAWFKLTQEYNTGGRQCSPMLLQRRWYQMKHTTRTKIYDFWQCYRGNPRLFAKAYKQKPTALQVKIAEKYRSLITDPFEQWEDLIKNKKIIPPGAFEKKKFKEKSSTENDPDLIVVEPHVETIEVGADSDGDEVDRKDETTNTDTDLKNGTKELVIKVEPTDSLIEVEEASAIKELENISIPVATADDRLVERLEGFEKSSIDRTEIVLPKITSVMGNVVMMENNIGENVVTDKNAQEIVQESKTSYCDDDDDVQIIPTTDKDIITLDDIDTSPEVISEDVNSVDKESNFDELLMDLEFVDDGIELEDNEVESRDEDLPEENEKGQESSEITDENDIESKIDRKLIMFPITFTKKIDHMEVFRNTSFLSVKGNDVIERALAESKPIFNKTSKEEQSDEEECDDVTESLPRLKFSNWRLQKPKNRSYNPIQLCKNPDFNTRLKKLTVGFFSSERNRLLYSVCKPLTVDLHKAFESSLVDNTLYLERTDSPSVVIKKEKEIDECKNTVSVIPSAIPIQSLIDNNKAKVQELLQAKEQTPINSVVTERNKIVKLPDIEQVRLVNQCLLTAEVSPITLVNNTSANKPPVKLVNAVHPAASPPATFQTSNVASKEITPVNIVNNDINAKRFVKRKFPAPKMKTLNTLPPWSLCSKPDTVYESLITKDTLYKMLCLLNGVDIKNVVKKNAKKTQNIDNEALVNKETNRIVKEKVAEVQTHISPKNVGGKPGASKLVNKNSESKTMTEDKITKKSNRTVSSKSGYCCWAQYRLQNLNSVTKLRHLCRKPNCKCCCRNYLVSKYIHTSKKFDTTEDLTTPHNSVDNPSIIREDTSMNTVTNQSSDERCQLDGNSVICSPVRAQVSTIDTTKNNLNSGCPIQSSLSKNTLDRFDSLQNLTWTDEVVQVTNTISLAGDGGEKVGACENVSLLSPRLSMKTTAAAVSHNTDLEQINLIHEHPTDVESSVIEIDTLNNQPDNSTDPISLISDDEDTSTPENIPPVTDQVLPNGVRLLLLPDNTLSLSIDPDAQIARNDLRKLPEILSAVQKQLTHSAVLQTSSHNSFTCVDNPNSDLNDSSLNGESNAIQVVRTGDNTNLGAVSNTQEIIDVDNTHLIVATQSHTGNNNSDVIYQDSRENSNSSPFILKSNDNLVERTHSYSFGNRNEREIESDTLNSTQENIASETNVTKLNCNRKTILSDLMTMSGISQEDSHVFNEEDTTIPNTPMPVTPTCNNTVNYNIDNNTDSSNTQQNVPMSKPIKKIVVSIRKKRKQNISPLSDSIIDLVDDCNTEIANENVTVMRQIVNGFQVSVAGKLISPLKYHQPYRPIILKRIPKTSTPYQIIQENVNAATVEHPERGEAGRIKSIPGKSTKKMSARERVHRGGVQMQSHYDSDSDSSDDEPLAKKMRRIRSSSSTAQNEGSNDNDYNIARVEEYNVPVEFESEPLTKENLAVHDMIQESYDEESCILGV